MNPYCKDIQAQWHEYRSIVEQPRTLTPETKMSGADSVKKMQDLSDKILASSQPKQPDNKEGV